MDVILPPAKPVPPRPSVGRQVLQGLVERNPFQVIGAPLSYLRNKAELELEALVVGGGVGETKLPGDSMLPKKVLQEAGQYVLPGNYMKALSEIGEGEIPFTDRSSARPGLGVREEGRIRAEGDDFQRLVAGERAAELQARRAAAITGLVTSAGALGATPADSLPTLVSGTYLETAATPGTITTGRLGGANTAAQPGNAIVQLALTLAKGVVRDLVTERSDP